MVIERHVSTNKATFMGEKRSASMRCWSAVFVRTGWIARKTDGGTLEMISCEIFQRWIPEISLEMKVRNQQRNTGTIDLNRPEVC